MESSASGSLLVNLSNKLGTSHTGRAGKCRRFLRGPNYRTFPVRPQIFRTGMCGDRASQGDLSGNNPGTALLILHRT